MNRTRAPAFRAAADRIAPGTKVAIIGHISRTWYRDYPVLYELFAWIQACGAEAWTLFRNPLMNVASAVVQHFPAAARDLLVQFEEGSVEAELILDERHVALCVLLVSRVSEDPAMSSPLFDRARAAGIPVLAVFASGDAVYLEG